jgi:hypothetical protein
MTAGFWCSTPMLTGYCRARKQARRYAWVRVRIKTEETELAALLGAIGRGQREFVQLLSRVFEALKDSARD